MKCKLPFPLPFIEYHFFVHDSSNCEFIAFVCCEYLIRDPFFVCLNRTANAPPPLLMNSGSFVLDCQPIRRITAGYECIIIMSLQGRAKLSPSVFRRLPNCCPITPRHLLDRNSVCSAESIRGGAYDSPLKKKPLCYYMPLFKTVYFMTN